MDWNDKPPTQQLSLVLIVILVVIVSGCVGIGINDTDKNGDSNKNPTTAENYSGNTSADGNQNGS